MCIKVINVPRIGLIDFVKENGLEIEVHERSSINTKFCGYKFYAELVNVYVKEGICIGGVSGDGNTVEGALGNLCTNISEQTLVVDPFKPTRREIYTDKIFPQKQ